MHVKQRIGCLVMALVMALMLGTTSALAYGGGGGGGGGGNSGGGGGDGASKKGDSWSPTELQHIFSGLTPSQNSQLVEAFTGTTISKRDLLEVRQVFNVTNMNDANRDAAIMDGMVKTLEVLDASGQLAQEGLAFVPGVGLVTTAGLDIARSGANAYRDGKTGKEIAIKTLSSGITNALTSKFSKIDSLLGKLRLRGSKILGSATQMLSKRARVLVKKLYRKGAKYATDKMTSSGTSTAVEAGLNSLAKSKAFANRASTPSYASHTPQSHFGMHK